MLQKIADLSAVQVIAAIKAGQIKDDHRIIWKAKNENDNVIFLATKDTLIDMITETTKPDDMFEIWQDIKKDDLKI